MVDTDKSLKTKPTNPDDTIILTLRNPLIAGLLAWLIPGLGHYYQGRYFKACLFSICIIPTFVFGCYLGSGKEIGLARNVYCSWRPGDKRLFFIPQCCIGFAAIPAYLQAGRVGNGLAPFYHGIMAPPALFVEQREQGYPPSLDEIIAKSGSYFEIGTIFTVVAGLMNLLVIFDAIDGPLLFREEPGKKEEDESEHTA